VVWRPALAGGALGLDLDYIGSRGETVMSARINMFVVAVVSAVLGQVGSAAASDGTPTAAQVPSLNVAADRPWVVRAEGAMLDTHAGSLGPHVEVGLTAGRFVAARLSIEGTLMKGPDTSWSAMANARWEPLRTESGRHALSLAAGPMVLVGNGVHGTTPLAHAELAYIVRAPGGLTLLAAVGENIALADSSYVMPAGGCFLSCPEELHRGDLLPHLRLAIGWTF
jgi:hypothetical protein